MKIQNIDGKVFGGVSPSTSGEIEIKVKIELSKDDREKYLWNYLNLPTNFIEPPTTTAILRAVVMTFSISVNAVGTPDQPHSNALILKQMSIYNTQGQLATILAEDSSPGKLRVSKFPKDSNQIPSFYANDYDKADTYLNESLMANDKLLIDKPLLKGHIGPLFQYDFLVDFQNQLEFIKPTRQIQKKAPSIFVDPSEVDEEGRNLVNLMDTMYSNNHEKFSEIVDLCKRIFPDILDIHPKKHRDGDVSMLVKKKNILSEIDLEHEASGMDQLFVIIWKIATSRMGSIWFLDEPELHLHPGAQKLLYDFLKDQTKKEAKQIFIATQSMVFIHKSCLDEVSIILNHDNVSIISLKALVEAQNLTTDTSEGYDSIRNNIYDALGYESRFSFEPDTIVVVEGIADERIITEFSKSLGKPVNLRNTRFIPMGDKGKIEKYIPVLAYTLSSKRCLIVLDNDNKNPQDFEEKILARERQYKNLIKAKPTLSKDDFHLFPEYVYSIEYYLLEAQAITQAAGKENDQGIIDKVQEEISDSWEDINNKKIKPKDFLKNIWERDFGPYNEVDTAVDIAKHISKEHLLNHTEISKLVNAISSNH